MNMKKYILWAVIAAMLLGSLAGLAKKQRPPASPLPEIVSAGVGVDSA